MSWFHIMPHHVRLQVHFLAEKFLTCGTLESEDLVVNSPFVAPVVATRTELTSTQPTCVPTTGTAAHSLQNIEHNSTSLLQ